MKTLFNKSLLSLALALGLASASLQAVHAVEGALGPMHEMHDKKDKERILASLNLSDEQKQDIQQIKKQLRQDNDVFKGEKTALRSEMKQLMEQDIWDAALAESLIRQGVETSAPIALNQAKARHAIFNVLDASQQSVFLEKQAQKSERERERRSLNIERLAKRLDLTDEQINELEAIQAAAKAENAASMTTLKANRDLQNAIVYSPSFDEDAWTALQKQSTELRVEAGIAGAYKMFQMLSVLDEDQRATFQKMMERKVGKKDKPRGKRKARN